MQPPERPRAPADPGAAPHRVPARPGGRRRADERDGGGHRAPAAPRDERPGMARPSTGRPDAERTGMEQPGADRGAIERTGPVTPGPSPAGTSRSRADSSPDGRSPGGAPLQHGGTGHPPRPTTTGGTPRPPDTPDGPGATGRRATRRRAEAAAGRADVVGHSTPGQVGPPAAEPGHPGGWGDCPGAPPADEPGGVDAADDARTTGRRTRRRARGRPTAPPADPPLGPTPGHGDAAGHGHGHGHGPATPAGRRVRNLLVALLVPCALAALAGVALLWPGAAPTPALPPVQSVHGDVSAVQVADCSPGSGDGACTGVTVAMTDGPRAGRDIVQLMPNEPSSPRFALGDPVTLSWSGGDPDDAGSYQLTDFQRAPALGWLAAAFAVAVVLLGRWRGVAALAGLVLSFAVLLWFVLPSILSGNPPLAVAVTGSGLIMFAVLYLTHGFSARTSCAVLGTLASLVLIGVLGYGFSGFARLTGLDDTTTNLIGTLGGVPIDARGLLLAGLVIGALGVLDDVTVTQAAAVWEVGSANPSLGARDLFAAGMRIGRDHVASAVNTLVLAYAGAALPLMLLFTVSSGNFGDVLTSQDVATEIVRTLVGSIGLVASVPVTTGLAALVVARR
ncbi:YibE/F family protein [Pseudonocardia nantongensis]|uniref:YibE/F family protein n=1 Tax=Pseudonocardia nantongensis TaxID=1181885 RepID=UPI00397A4506